MSNLDSAAIQTFLTTTPAGHVLLKGDTTDGRFGRITKEDICALPT
jgi:hypothetical protein